MSKMVINITAEERAWQARMVEQANGRPLRYFVGASDENFGTLDPASDEGLDSNGFLGEAEAQGARFPLSLEKVAEKAVRYVLAFEAETIVFLSPDCYLHLRPTRMGWVLSMKLRIGKRVERFQRGVKMQDHEAIVDDLRKMIEQLARSLQQEVN